MRALKLGEKRSFMVLARRDGAGGVTVESPKFPMTIGISAAGGYDRNNGPAKQRPAFSDSFAYPNI
jgi:hypothetical protein